MHRRRYPDLVRAAFLILPLLLAGCAIFAPRYDATLDTTITAAAGDVAEIAAKAELGSYADKASFDAASDTYAGAVGKLKIAELRAGNLPVQGTIATRERGNLVSFITECSRQVLSLAGIHKNTGIAPNAGLTEPMMIACDRSVRAAQAMKQ